MSKGASESVKGKRKKNADGQREVTSLRRSARLSQRYKSRHFPLATSVYSRQSLGQYGADESLSTQNSSLITTSVLDESGQSVPIDFEDEEDIIRHDHSYSKGVSSSMVRRNGAPTQPIDVETHIMHSTLEHPETPRNPDHLFGLDENDEELELLMRNRDFNIYTKEKILTPPKTKAPTTHTGPSCFDQILYGIGGIFYYFGSLVYILFNSIVCCDTSILFRGGGITSRFCWRGFQSFVYFILIFGFVFISSTAPHVQYTPPVYQPTPPPTPQSSPPVKSTIAVTTTVTSTETLSPKPVPSPTPLKDEELYNSLEALRREFGRYKDEQTGSLEALKKYLEEYINQSSVEFSSLSGRLDSTVTGEVGKERNEREVKMKELKDALLQKLNSELGNSNQSLNDRLEKALSEIADQVSESGKTDSPAVRMIVQGVVDEAVSQLRESLEGMIRELKDSILLLKSEHASDLKLAYEEWKTKFKVLQDKLSQEIQDNKKQIDNQEAKISAERTAREEEIKRLREELSTLSINIEKLEKQMVELELKVSKLTTPTTTPTPDVTPGISNEKVQDMIDATLNKYSSDQIGRFDFALESAGGHVIDSSDTYDPSKTKPQLFGITLPITLSRTYPGVVIQPAVLPGDCWCFKGTQGHVTIKLASPAIVDAVTLQHIPKQLSPIGRISSAVRTFTVIGMQSPTAGGLTLGTFEYSAESSPIQTFAIDNKNSFGYIKFQFDSNHGNPDYTCVYRVRVHGSLLSSTP